MDEQPVQIQTEASALPWWVRRDAQDLAARVGGIPQAHNLLRTLDALGYEMVIEIRPRGSS